MVSDQDISEFRKQVLDYYREKERELPWRKAEPDGYFDPYKILVSEIMLQQTQVTRVIDKYNQFIRTFPSIKSLASADLTEVLTIWQGLGYNRRARFLREAAIHIQDKYDENIPRTIVELIRLPGIGHNTAAAVLVYAFNQPHVFIETNIRTVYLYHFFAGSTDVPDKLILELIPQTLDKNNPRQWYWALMDYGNWLKKEHGNASRRSRHYSRQSKFEGSIRQLRGALIRTLADGPQPEVHVINMLNDERAEEIIDGLIRDKLVARDKSDIRIAD